MSECRIWVGARTRDGYGLADVGDLYTDGKRHRTLAHRAVWLRVRGPLASRDVTLHHTCGNKLCVNLDHLEVRGRSEHAALHRNEVCLRGHLMDEANSYYWRGIRQCRACWKARRDERRAKVVMPNDTVDSDLMV
jgi:HNH endonuclease